MRLELYFSDFSKFWLFTLLFKYFFEKLLTGTKIFFQLQSLSRESVKFRRETGVSLRPEKFDAVRPSKNLKKVSAYQGKKKSIHQWLARKSAAPTDEYNRKYEMLADLEQRGIISPLDDLGRISDLNKYLRLGFE